MIDAFSRTLGDAHPATLAARNNLALTLCALGDLAGARGHQQAVIDARSRTLGDAHPATTVSARNLLRTLDDQEEGEAAEVTLHRHLLWLLDADPEGLSGDQRTIRGYVAERIWRRT